MQSMVSPTIDTAGTRHLGWRDWLFFSLQVALVVGVELSDDLFHGLVTQRNARIAESHALQIAQFEASHNLWVEPGIQRFFEQPHHLLDLVIDWAQVVPIVNAVYGLAHVFVTLGFALWVFLRRRALFRFLRNVFLLTDGFALVLYNAYPLAPPRLASGLQDAGRPFHFVDTVFGAGKGVQIGFDEFAAMPSLHVGWAIIVGLSLFWSARPLPVRLVALTYPLLMTLAVVVTGNHYLMDALVALAVVALATGISLLMEARPRGESLAQVLHRLNRTARQLPGSATAPQRMEESAATRQKTDLTRRVAR